MTYVDGLLVGSEGDGPFDDSGPFRSKVTEQQNSLETKQRSLYEPVFPSHKLLYPAVAVATEVHVAVQRAEDMLCSGQREKEQSLPFLSGGVNGA